MVDDRELDVAKQHFEQTLGELPAVMRELSQSMPDVFIGYARMRSFAMGPDAQVPAKYRELIFILLDVVLGNIEGAELHAKAARAAGLAEHELLEGLTQLLLVAGIASWDRACPSVLRSFREAD